MDSVGHAAGTPQPLPADTGSSKSQRVTITPSPSYRSELDRARFLLLISPGAALFPGENPNHPHGWTRNLH